jgi:hypothetical protein
MRHRYYTIEQSDYGYRTVIFLCYRTIGISNIVFQFKKVSDYRISDQGLNLSDYWISDSEKTIAVAHHLKAQN